MDPNKYKDNDKITPDTLLKTIISIVAMLLMVLGIVGLAMEAFKENNVFGQVFSYLFQSTQTMLLIPVVLFVLWLLNRFISAPTKGETKSSGNLPMYLMVLIGIYYAYRLITTGGL